MPKQETSSRVKTRSKYKEPKKYVVIIFNDDFTTMDFVVMILMKIFHKTKEDAEQLMLKVHNEGQAAVGVYSYDMARTKVNLSMSMAQEKGFPLRLVFQPE